VWSLFDQATKSGTINGIKRAADAVAGQAKSDLTTAYNDARLQIQLLLAATAINLKRLAHRPPAARTPPPAKPPRLPRTSRSSTTA